MSDLPCLCDQTQGLFLKFVGVFPQGVNRLHDAIDNINKGQSYKKRVELVSSKFSKEHSGYVVEIYIAYQSHNGDIYSDYSIDQSIPVELFNAIHEFQPK